MATVDTENPALTIRERAALIVMLAKGGRDGGTLTGTVAGRYTIIPMSLRRLADHGVPADVDLAFDSEELRALVQELAQIEVD